MGAWGYCIAITGGGGQNCSYATEAAAVAATIAIYTPQYCSVALNPISDWPAPMPAPSLDLGEERIYGLLLGSIEAGNCVILGTVQNPTFKLIMDRTRNYTCPVGYVGSVNSSGACFSNAVGNISHTVLDCPQEAASAIIGDPCDASTGDYFQTDVDYEGPTLRFTRSYHSETLPSHNALGIGWSHNFGGRLVINPSNGAPTGIERPDGFQDQINLINGEYISVSGAGIHVAQNPSTGNFTVFLADGSSEIYLPSGTLSQIVARSGAVTTLVYDASGNLSAVTGPYGHTLAFNYANNQISAIADPSGALIRYTYDSQNNLKTVTYPDGSVRTYLYENTSLPNNLTGLIDESNSRFSTIAYDSIGRVSSSQQANGANAVTITGYGDSTGATTTTVTDALGANITYNFTSQRFFTRRVQSIVKNALTESHTVPLPSADAQQRATQSVDPNGNITNYIYDSDHLTSKTESFSTASARTTSYLYLATSTALPTLVTEALRKTAYVYYPSTNNINTKTVTDTTVTPNVSRTWTYTYNANGQVLTIDGPRTDVTDKTTYTYYTCVTGSQCGQIETITNAVGQTTTFNTYNSYGQPLTITDPNGLVVTLTYDLRQRLKSQEVGTETTSYSYYPTGLLETVTLPDNSTVQYTYDGAHRLTDITDGLGNHIHYTLDNMGNRTAENTYDPSSTLKRTHTRVINTLNELSQDINAAGTAAVTTTYGYDNNGNQTSSDAPLSRNTVSQYDALNRLQQVTDPANGVTKTAYDANNQIVSVIDPRTLSTIYTRNGFGDALKQVSPDSGTTTSTFDSGGNLKTLSDARGAQVTNTYDALNRVTQQAYSDETINFTYDTGTNGKGRLTGASDANHSMSWAYDTLGRVSGKSQVVAGVTKSVGFSYANGDLITLTTPSNQTITYGYTNHRITSIKVGSTTLLSGVTYFPFGSVGGWTWGNASTVNRTYNTDGNVSRIVTAGDVLTFGYDNALRISSLSDTLFSSSSYTAGYDALDRLSSLAQTGVTSNWTFDADGNHLTQTGTSTVTTTPSTTSNRLNSISGSLVRTYAYDAAGNTLSYTGASFGFNKRGRMSSATVGSTGASYIYNALGQLVEKTVGGVTTLLMYDEAGHLLGEYSSTGALIQETVWMDDRPVATLRPNGSGVSIYYVHTDHLNAPRIVTQSTDNSPRWLWGGNAANQNPLGLGTFTYNLRYPGQYFQAETGLSYNYFRDYDSVTGRYLESDPIGLAGGSYSTYSYVDNNPISNIDPSGLQRALPGLPGLPISPGGIFNPFQGESMHFADLVMQAASQLADTVGQMCKTCPACTPYPKGTIGWTRLDTTHTHYPIMGPHVHLRQVNQRPGDCKCFWNDAKPDVAAPPPAPGWVDLTGGEPPLSP
jgi:RHS repeat-associated protein